MRIERGRSILRASRFEMNNGKLHKWSYGGPLLRCVNNQEVGEIMTEVHEGTCSVHQGADTLYRRILLLGYY